MKMEKIGSSKENGIDWEKIKKFLTRGLLVLLAGFSLKRDEKTSSIEVPVGAEVGQGMGQKEARGVEADTAMIDTLANIPDTISVVVEASEEKGEALKNAFGNLYEIESIPEDIVLVLDLKNLEKSSDGVVKKIKISPRKLPKTKVELPGGTQLPLEEESEIVLMNKDSIETFANEVFDRFVEALDYYTENQEQGWVKREMLRIAIESLPKEKKELISIVSQVSDFYEKNNTIIDLALESKYFDIEDQSLNVLHKNLTILVVYLYQEDKLGIFLQDKPNIDTKLKNFKKNIRKGKIESITATDMKNITGQEFSEEEVIDFNILLFVAKATKSTVLEWSDLKTQEDFLRVSEEKAEEGKNSEKFMLQLMGENEGLREAFLNFLKEFSKPITPSF